MQPAMVEHANVDRHLQSLFQSVDGRCDVGGLRGRTMRKNYNTKIQKYKDPEGQKLYLCRQKCGLLDHQLQNRIDFNVQYSGQCLQVCTEDLGCGT